ncbi:uncharacterized protein LOC119914523 isoform X3 [Micropterus salmoides]|uniref:uncharacterized protein LOC119914523 isoform X3 n=1 Tax=Micropterus salmoides TaxID=27706 RepID=UPI0018EDCDFA|nr:uncharacterized protein LOC119914523 isoform X3 [Micropterus salmoides]
MATDFTQDTVLYFIQSSGGSVKNSELLLHFRHFLQEHEDRARNRELFKKFVNSVATVRQVDGVSHVVLRTKFKGYVPGGGERGSSGPPRFPAGKNTEHRPQKGKLSPAESAEKSLQKAQRGEATTPAGKTVLPAAGIKLNNNNVERNLNLKQQQVVSTSELSGRPAAAQAVSQTSEGLSKLPVRDQCTKVGQQRVGLGPPSAITPVVPSVRHHGETSQHVPVPQTIRQTTNSLAPEGSLHQELPLHPQVAPLHKRYRPSYKAAVSYDEDEEEEVPMRPGFDPPPTIAPVVAAVRHHGETRQQVPVPDPIRQSEASLVPEGGLHHNSLPPQVAPLHKRYRPSYKSAVSYDDDEEDEVPMRPGFGRSPAIAPVVAAVRHHGETSQQAPVPETIREREASLAPEGGLHQEPSQNHISLPPQVAPPHRRYRQSYKSAVSYDKDEMEEAPMRQGSAAGAWPLRAPLRDTGGGTSASLPGIIDQSAPPTVISSSSSEKKLPGIYIQDVEGEILPPGGPGWCLESGVGMRGQGASPRLVPGSAPGEAVPTRRSLPLEAELYRPSPDRAKEVPPHRGVHTDHQYSQSAGVQLEGPDQSQRESLSSSPRSVFSPSSDTGISSRDWPPSGSPGGSELNSSYEDLWARTGKGSKIQEVLQRAQRTASESETHCANTKTLAPWHDSNDNPLYNQDTEACVLPWHLSKGDLHDDRGEVESSEGSTSSPPLRPRSAATRLSSKLRSRMCRSLGANLDELVYEEARGGSEAARLNRLHLISSSLSLRYNLSSSSLSSCSTPPRCRSLADLVEGVERKGGRRSLPATATSTSTSTSTAHHEGPGRQSLVPLEPREHAWLVKGAAGAWPDIYSLFREDPSLLNRQDFISGFTVLHWIAKHGDHRVLNTLWYGVEKAGLTFDINARSTCGHTPLHIAAIHGHKNIMQLLVKKFNANVKLRDMAGKKPWQYLSRTLPPEVFHLLGAPLRAAVEGQGGVANVDSSWKGEQQQRTPHRQRRRHHLSMASSGERPLIVSGTTRVKRSTSIAAFLKHKSLQRFQGNQSDSSI